jgi:hypothetical protein
MTVLVLLSIFPNGHWNIFEALVTMEDKVALGILLLYVAYHVTRSVLYPQTHLFKPIHNN